MCGFQQQTMNSTGWYQHSKVSKEFVPKTRKTSCHGNQQPDKDMSLKTPMTAGFLGRELALQKEDMKIAKRICAGPVNKMNCAQ